MAGENLWWSYWYFHFPNYVLALLFWTLIGRFVFAIFLPADSPNYIYRWFRRLTDWLMRPVAFITPSIVPPGAGPCIPRHHAETGQPETNDGTSHCQRSQGGEDPGAKPRSEQAGSHHVRKIRPGAEKQHDRAAEPDCEEHVGRQLAERHGLQGLDLAEPSEKIGGHKQAGNQSEEPHHATECPLGPDLPPMLQRGPPHSRAGVG